MDNFLIKKRVCSVSKMGVRMTSLMFGNSGREIWGFLHFIHETELDSSPLIRILFPVESGSIMAVSSSSRVEVFYFNNNSIFHTDRTVCVMQPRGLNLYVLCISLIYVFVPF